MRCDDCKFWSVSFSQRHPATNGSLGLCAQTRDLTEATDVDDKRSYRAITAFTQNNTPVAYASFWTRPDHFCAMFQAKEG